MLLVDLREPESIKELIADDVTVVKLWVGDLLDPESGLLMERKKDIDFHASFLDGRLDSQCARLAKITELPVYLSGVRIVIPIKVRVLLIHGSLLPKGDPPMLMVGGRATKWNYWSAMMKLMSIQQSGILVPMPIPPTRLLDDCVSKLRGWAKKKKHRVVHRPRGIWSKPPPQVEMMGLLVGGPVKARVILEKYGSISTALQNMEHWPELPGVGPKAAIRAMALLDRK